MRSTSLRSRLCAALIVLAFFALAAPAVAIPGNSHGHGHRPPPTTLSTIATTTTTTLPAPTTTTTVPTTPGPIIDCQGATHGPVHLTYVTGTVIRNCVFVDADVQLYATDHSTVQNNRFVSTDGTAHNSALIISDFDTNGLIDSNIIDGAGIYDDAIVLDYAAGTVVTNNSTSGTYDCGIEFVDKIASVMVDGNDISSGGQCGVGGWFGLTLNDSTISNNATTGSARYGVYLSAKAGSSGNVVSHNSGPIYVYPPGCCTVS